MHDNRSTDPSVNTESHRHVAADRLVARALRDQPLRNAPSTLEARVLAAITQRETKPWWQQSFLHWPVAARGAFLLVSLGFVRLGMALWNVVSSLLGGFESTAVTTTFAPGVAWTRTAFDLAAGLGEALRATSTGIPQIWLYGGAMAVVALYVLFFGLSAVGYRAFQLSR